MVSPVMAWQAVMKNRMTSVTANNLDVRIINYLHTFRLKCSYFFSVSFHSSCALPRIKIAVVPTERHYLLSSTQPTPIVNRLTIVPKKTVQLKTFPIEESSLDSDVIARPKRAETINIRPAGVAGKRNQDPLSGLIAYFEGSALEVHLIHPPIERLDTGTWTGVTAPTLIPIVDTFLDTD